MRGTMPFGVHSEPGRRRRVLVHRPGVERKRLAPSSAEDLLFDDVLCVSRAQAARDAFWVVMRDHERARQQDNRCRAEPRRDQPVRIVSSTFPMT